MHNLNMLLDHFTDHMKNSQKLERFDYRLALDLKHILDFSVMKIFAPWNIKALKIKQSSWHYSIIHSFIESGYHMMCVQYIGVARRVWTVYRTELITQILPSCTGICLYLLAKQSVCMFTRAIK